jgi:methylated-DNA-[protein]-cysteine S-methyltransferase
MKHIHIQYYKTPVGELILGAYGNQLCMADWCDRKVRHSIDARLQNGLKAKYVEQNAPVLEKTRRQLDEYFNQARTSFAIPLLLVGTGFQKQVWLRLMAIPYGTTASYLELARNIGNEKAVRAVATATGANAISIIIPCHRVLGSDGSLVGYAGGLPAKRKLLVLEQPR